MSNPSSLLVLLLICCGNACGQTINHKTINQNSTVITGGVKTIAIPVSIRPMARLPLALYESSGIEVLSPNRIWSHEDANNTNQLYCVDTTGALLRTLTISNATNVDWEDLATDNLGRMYVCDAGNNNNNRTNLAIYRIPNPDNIPGNTVVAEIIKFAFADQTLFPPPVTNRNFDIEALIWHNDSLFLFTKNRSTPQNGYCKMYKLPAQPGTFTAQLLDSIYLGNTDATARITAADLHPATGELVLLTGTRILSFRNYPANRFFRGTMVEYIFNTLPGQNEGLAFVAPNRLYMTEEGVNSVAGLLYEIILPVTGTGSNLYSEPLLNIFPNPAGDLITIDCPWPDSSKLKLHDIRGRLLYQSTLGKSRQVDLSGFPPGNLYVILTQGEQKITRCITRR